MNKGTLRRLVVAGLGLNLVILGLMSYDFFIHRCRSWCRGWSRSASPSSPSPSSTCWPGGGPAENATVRDGEAVLAQEAFMVET